MLASLSLASGDSALNVVLLLIALLEAVALITLCLLNRHLSAANIEQQRLIESFAHLALAIGASRDIDARLGPAILREARLKTDGRGEAEPDQDEDSGQSDAGQVKHVTTIRAGVGLAGAKT